MQLKFKFKDDFNNIKEHLSDLNVNNRSRHQRQEEA